MVKWIIEEIKDLCNFDWLFWKPIEHKISNSKCTEFNISPMCVYCKTQQYNTCLIECNRKNLTMVTDPVWQIRYGMEEKFYGDYSRYMVCAVEKYFPEYQNIINEYTAEQLKLNLK